jgi:hypothetical protein
VVHDRRLCAFRFPRLQRGRPRAYSSEVGATISVLSTPAISRVWPLLRWRLPSTVFRRVGPIVVASAQRCARGPFTHIYQKLREGIPFGADSNPPPSVVNVVRRAWIQASLPHTRPRFIGSRGQHCSAAASCVSMLWSWPTWIGPLNDRHFESVSRSSHIDASWHTRNIAFNGNAP